MSNGRLCIGFKMFVVIYGFPNAVNNNGAVSPATLATESITPDSIPLNPHGTTIFKITLWYGNPKASPASFNEEGISFNVSSVERIIMGNIIIANATLPDKAENVPNGFTNQK